MFSKFQSQSPPPAPSPATPTTMYFHSARSKQRRLMVSTKSQPLPRPSSPILRPPPRAPSPILPNTVLYYSARSKQRRRVISSKPLSQFPTLRVLPSRPSPPNRRPSPRAPSPTSPTAQTFYSARSKQRRVKPNPSTSSQPYTSSGSSIRNLRNLLLRRNSISEQLPTIADAAVPPPPSLTTFSSSDSSGANHSVDTLPSASDVLHSGSLSTSDSGGGGSIRVESRAGGLLGSPMLSDHPHITTVRKVDGVWERDGMVDVLTTLRSMKSGKMKR